MEDFLSRHRVVQAMVIFVSFSVEVVILQEEMLSLQPAYVGIGMTAYAEGIP